LDEYQINDVSPEQEDDDSSKRRSVVFGQSSLEGFTLLHWAVESNHPLICELLLSKYPSLINKGDVQKATPLHYASLNGSTDLVKFLVGQGAQLLVDISGDSPLHLACLNGHISVVKYLCEKGADYNLQSNNGTTPLHLAVTNKHVEVIGYLLSLPKLKRDVMDNNGNTPATIANSSKDQKLIDYFEDEKRELHQKIRILQDRTLFLESKINEANIIHENDQRSISKAYKQIKEIEDELKFMKEELKNKREEQIDLISNNDLMETLRNEIDQANFNIAQLESENKKLERRTNRQKEDFMNSLTSEYRSLTNLINLFETTSLSLTDSKDMLENIRNFFTPSINTNNNDMEQG